ncbi:MAG: DUF535 family protein [Agrobacterium tumefaciens]|nr:DUF535 family protein [Agrobacterium tumefaciens]
MSRTQDAAALAEKFPVPDDVAETVSDTARFLLFWRIITFVQRARWKRAVLFWMRFAANPFVTFRWWWFLAAFSARQKLPPPHDELLQKPLSKFLLNKVSQKRRLAFLMDNFAIADRHFSRNVMAGLWAGKTVELGAIRGRNDEYRCILTLADRCGGRHEGAFAVRLLRDHDDAVLWTATFIFLQQCESVRHTIVVGGMQGPRAAKEQMVSVTRDLAGLRPKEATLMVLQGLISVNACHYLAIGHSRHPIRYRRTRRQKMMVSDIDAFWRERSAEPEETFGFKVPVSSLEGTDKRSRMKLCFYKLGRGLAGSKPDKSE